MRSGRFYLQIDRRKVRVWDGCALDLASSCSMLNDDCSPTQCRTYIAIYYICGKSEDARNRIINDTRSGVSTRVPTAMSIRLRGPGSSETDGAGAAAPSPSLCPSSLLLTSQQGPRPTAMGVRRHRWHLHPLLSRSIRPSFRPIRLLCQFS